ncbi:MAG: hypothetical protein AAF138_00525, partial [Planctomycetota bacterium]
RAKKRSARQENGGPTERGGCLNRGKALRRFDRDSRLFPISALDRYYLKYFCWGSAACQWAHLPHLPFWAIRRANKLLSLSFRVLHSDGFEFARRTVQNARIFDLHTYLGLINTIGLSRPTIGG